MGQHQVLIMFVFGIVGAMGTLLGGAWMVAQAVQKTASNPVYDIQFEYGEKTMTELKTTIELLKSEVREVRHGQNNLRASIQGLADDMVSMPERIMKEIRTRGGTYGMG